MKRVVLGILAACTYGIILIGLNADTTTNIDPAQSSTSAPVKQFEQKRTVKIVKEIASIPYSTEKRSDSSILSGQTKVVTKGENGSKTLTYEVTYVGDKAESKKLVSTEVTKQPIAEIIAVGTRAASVCPNGSYTNTYGQTVCRPSSENRGDATALCRDGTYSYSRSRRGTCSYHGGVSRWL